MNKGVLSGLRIPSQIDRYSSGLLAARPDASIFGVGFYYATDYNGGTLYRSDGSTWASIAPAGVLDQSWSDIQVTVTNSNSSVATSADLQVAVQWDHGYRTVEVRLESFVGINGISQAAGLKVAITMYVCDSSLANNGLYANPYNPSMSPASYVYHTFHDTTTGFQLGVWNTVVTHVEAAPGTLISLSGRAYQSLGSAATWNASLGYFSPIVMTARELL